MINTIKNKILNLFQYSILLYSSFTLAFFLPFFKNSNLVLIIYSIAILFCLIAACFLHAIETKNKLYFSIRAVEINKLNHFKYIFPKLENAQIPVLIDFILNNSSLNFIKFVILENNIIFQSLDNISYKEANEDIQKILIKNDSFINILKKEDIKSYNNIYLKERINKNLSTF